MRYFDGRQRISLNTPGQTIHPKVLELAEDRIPVKVTCRVLKISRQGFMKWRRNPTSNEVWEDAHLTNLLFDLPAEYPVYGYRFLADEVQRLGFKASERRIWRLCSQQGLFSLHSRKCGLSRKPRPPVHDYLVRRVFKSGGVNQLWLTDVTEYSTSEGTLYLCAVKDVHSNRIVGYSIDSRMTAQLEVSAFRNAARLRDTKGTVVHSGRGSQFRCDAFLTEMRVHGLVGSIGRVGACADNASMESLFSLLQMNVLNQQRWATREELRLAILVWIEKKYHRGRRQLALGRFTPVEFEIQETVFNVA